MSIPSFWADTRVKDDGAWYGPLTAMVPLPNVRGSLTSEGGRETLWTERGDGAAQAMVLPSRGREWSCSADGLRPDEVAMIRYAADGLLGVAAHWWLPPDATQHNVLTPAMCEGVGWQGAGAVHSGAHTVDPAVGDGWAPRTVAAAVGSTVVLPAVPVRPSRSVSAAVCAIGAGAKCSVQWLNAAGAAFATAQLSTSGGGASVLTRLGGSEVAPVNARAARLVLTGGTLYANPSLSWTGLLRPFAPGAGCDSSWLYAPSYSVDRTGQVPRHGVSFSVREV